MDEFSIDEKDVNAEIEESEGEEVSDSDVDEGLYVQLAGSKSEEEVDDEVMCRHSLVPRGARGGEGGDGGEMVKSSALQGRGCIVVAHLCIHAK